MTTDPFTEAARAEAEKRHQGDWDPYEQEPVDDWGLAEAERRAFVAGAEWARDAIGEADWRDSDRVEVDGIEGRIVVGRETVGKHVGRWAFPSGLHFGDDAVANLNPKAVPASAPKPHRPTRRGEPMTTDTTALEDRLWDAIAEARDRGERTAHDVDSYDIVDAVLPLIAAEVRAARADAWDEGYEAGMFDTYRLGRDMELTIAPAPNPYRETGDSDERR